MRNVVLRFELITVRALDMTKDRLALCSEIFTHADRLYRQGCEDLLPIYGYLTDKYTRFLVSSTLIIFYLFTSGGFIIALRDLLSSDS